MGTTQVIVIMGTNLKSPSRYPLTSGGHDGTFIKVPGLCKVVTLNKLSLKAKEHGKEDKHKGPIERRSYIILLLHFCTFLQEMSNNDAKRMTIPFIQSFAFGVILDSSKKAPLSMTAKR